MNKYTFFVEFDGVKTISNTYENPVETIQTDSVKNAINLFASKNKIKETSYDSLGGGEYRIFFNKRKLFNRSRELIYFVQLKKGVEKKETVSRSSY